MSGGTTNASMATTAAAAAASSLPLHNVFVYGSLLADDVVNMLLKRLPPRSPAVLRGYHRFSIKGRVYPAILPVESKSVTGRVLLGITDTELNLLDIFEDGEYKRNTVEVSLNGDQEKLLVETYVWGDEEDPNLYGSWDFEEWERLEMKDFLLMTQEFIEEFEHPDSKSRVVTYEAYYNKEKEG
ncbi:Protein AIG2 [Apostasia shenzhenica]|uniref:Putative gamma-glutamylcyclotransferase n=1 Tax=Apostasia shenzhenica TaxID=1088818 RepID=A0A2I0B415_9ASPA|nr:Protein AIG2 [Apostasia shenzhenica]